MRVVTFIEQQPRLAQAAGALVALGLLGALDYFTGPGLSVSLFYSMLVFVVAWFGERRFGVVFAALCAASWCWANKDVHPYGGPWGYAWATVSRLGCFVLVAIGSSAVKTKQETDRQRIEALERAKALESEIARISEHEQRRIGQDLHDGVCQMMAAIRCAASSLRDDLRLKNLPEAEASAEIADLLGDAVIEIRQLARGIFPVQMEAAGLAVVLDELVDSIRRLQRADVSFEMRGDVAVPSPEVAMHLYRIAQEGLNNALKHARAKRIVVGLKEAGQVLTLTVADNGGGMASPNTQLQDGMGLKTMRYRAQLIGARLTVDSTAEGVTLTCVLPLERMSS